MSIKQSYAEGRHRLYTAASEADEKRSMVSNSQDLKKQTVRLLSCMTLPIRM